MGRRKDAGFDPRMCETVWQVAQQIAIAVENALAFREIAALKDTLAKEKVYLEEEIQRPTTLRRSSRESRGAESGAEPGADGGGH